MNGKNWNEMTEAEQDTSLDETAELFFEISEETHGTGVASRMVKGEYTQVIINPAENAEFHAQQRTEADIRNAEQEAIWELMERLNS